MSTIRVELTLDEIDKLLNVLEPEAEALILRIRKLKEYRDQSKANAKAVLGSATQIPLVSAPASSMWGKRVAKGETERLVKEYLQSLNGKPVGVKEISNATHTKYGSCVRILRGLAEKNQVLSNKRLWKWAPHHDLVGANGVHRQ